MRTQNVGEYMLVLALCLIDGAVITTMAVARVHLIQLMNAVSATGGHRPSNQTNRLGLGPPASSPPYHPHPPSPVITVGILLNPIADTLFTFP